MMRWWVLWLTTFLVLLLLVVGTIVIGSYAVAEAPGGPGGSSSQAKFGWWMIAVGIVAALATIALGIYGAVKTYRTLKPAFRQGIDVAKERANEALLDQRLARIDRERAGLRKAPTTVSATTSAPRQQQQGFPQYQDLQMFSPEEVARQQRTFGRLPTSAATR
jgi:heme/copper-type cytochrome/quinol oxidase subunit 2